MKAYILWLDEDGEKILHDIYLNLPALMAELEMLLTTFSMAVEIEQREISE